MILQKWFTVKYQNKEISSVSLINFFIIHSKAWSDMGKQSFAGATLKHFIPKNIKVPFNIQSNLRKISVWISYVVIL